MPVFFLFFEYEGKNEPQNAYIVHFDEPIMEKALKRLRGEEIGDEVKLHKKTFDISYRTDHRLNSLNGTGMKERISDHIGNFKKYCERKVNYVKTVGFIGTGNEITAQFKIEIHPHELLADFGIGLRDSIDLGEFVGVNKRFGVAAPRPFVKGAKATLMHPENRNPDTTGVIIIKETDFSSEIKLKSDVYVPIGGTFDASNSFLKIKFSTPFNDFIVSPLRGMVEILPKQISEQTYFKIEDIYYHFCLIEVMSKSRSRQSAFILKAIADKFPVCCAEVIPDFVSEINVKLFEIIKKAWAIAKKLEIQDIFRISIDQIHQLQDKLNIFYCLLGFQAEELIVKNPSDVNKKYTTKTCGVPIVQALNIEGLSIVLAIAAIGVPEVETTSDDSEMIQN